MDNEHLTDVTLPGTIPVHHLPDQRSEIQVEAILPAAQEVRNGIHRHDFHELFFFAKGSGTHMIDLDPYAVNAPCLHVVAPGQVHQLDRSPDMEGMVVMFSGNAHPGNGHAAHSLLFPHAGRPSSFPLGAQEMEEAMALVGQIRAETERPEGPVVGVIEGYLGILLIKCHHWSERSAPREALQLETHDPVRRFLQLVDLDFLTERQVGQYADRLAVSSDHLNELVKKRLGRTASRVIQDRLLLEAKRLLLHSELTVKEVGYALNMKDPAYFTRWFGKAEGTPPVAFRDLVREKYKP